MSSPSASEAVAQKRKRSPSRTPEADGAPPSSRRRSRSPSEASDSDSDGPTPPKDGQLESRVAAMEIDNAQKSNSTAVAVAEKEKEKESAQRAEFAKLLNTRSGGVYIPPARLRAMQEAAAADKTSAEYQRLSWDALRKSITGIVNRVNVGNIKMIIPELFNENLIRGRGLFARSIMKAQAASLPFTPVFAALVAVINTKLPQVGELLLTRLISQFRRAFKRNDKIVCHSTTTFIAHLVNQAVAHEIIALQILVLLLERPTDDSIEIAVGFTREVGAFLAENSPKANATVFERFRAVLNEGRISQRVQYMIEVLMQVRKDKYKDNPIIPEGLDLVEEEEQITHQIQLEEELQVQEGLNVFKFDPNYLENEEKYKAIKAEILGDESDDESGSEESDEESDEDEEVVAEKEGIEDRTETNLVNLRRVIYLTIMNALNYEEAVHKLLKVQLQEGQEIEMVNMIIECCSQERSYSTFYGLIGERFSRLNRVWTDCFEQAFVNYYTTIHRYETNRLRNIARFFGYLFSSDAISWVVLDCVKINEEDTTSSSRIFVKIMMQEMMESMGLKTLAERFKDPEIRQATAGMFPTDIPKNTRFSINYFTSIGLGILTEDMREYLKNAPKLIMEQRRAMLEAETSSSSDSDSDNSDSDTSSDSDSDDGSSDSSSSGESSSDESRGRGKRRGDSRSPSRTPPRRRARDDSRSVSRTPPRRKAERSITPPRRATRRDSGSRSPSTPPRRRRDEDSRSPPPPPRDRERERERYRERSPIPPPRDYGRDRDGRNKDRDMDTRPDYSSRRRQSPPPPRDSGYPDRDRRDRDRRPARSPSPVGRGVRERSRSPPPHMSSRRDGRDDGRDGRGGSYREKDRPRSPPRRERDRESGRERRDSRERDAGYSRRR